MGKRRLMKTDRSFAARIHKAALYELCAALLLTSHSLPRVFASERELHPYCLSYLAFMFSFV